MSDQPAKTPLLELARSVPKDFRGEWEIQWFDDGTPSGHAMAPVGKYVHDLADEIEHLTAEVTDLRGRGSYLVAEVKDAWDRGRISVDTYHAALALEQITDSGRQEQNDTEGNNREEGHGHMSDEDRSLQKFLEDYAHWVVFNANDLFGYACADAVAVEIDTIPLIHQFQKKWGHSGVWAVLSKIRGCEPLKEVQDITYKCAIAELSDHKSMWLDEESETRQRVREWYAEHGHGLSKDAAAALLKAVGGSVLDVTDGNME